MADTKIDLFKELKAEYKANSRPALIETTIGQYLAVRGQGEPGGGAFKECIEALYSMALTVKISRKAAGLGDYAVCKLESLYGIMEDDERYDMLPERSCWNMMIRTPDCVGKDDLDKAVEALLDKGKCKKVKEVMLQELNEGNCVQMLHIGPYDQVGKAIAEMTAFAGENELAFTGKHHEIYLSDPRRVPPEKLKTIVRRSVW